jgi:hypothetical protein
MFLLAWRCFRWPFLVNVLAASLFVTTNAYYLHASGHVQLLTCYDLPFLILLQIESIRAARSGAIRRFAVLACTFGVLLGALLISGFYLPYFFMLIDLLVLALLVLFNRRAVIGAGLPTLRRYGWFAAAQLLWLALCVAPFLAIYLPKAVETGMHPVSDMLPYALRPWDAVNVGPHNLLWSYFYNQTLGHLVADWQGSPENQTGATPILFVLFLISGFSLRSNPTRDWRRATLFAMWCADLMVLLVVTHFPHQQWVWAQIYRWIPGAAGIRVVSRIQLVLLIPTTLIACHWIAETWRQHAARPVLVLLAGLLLVEQVNNFPIFNIDRPAEAAFFASMDRIPPACRAFFAENSRPGPDVQTLYRHNVDSMMVAELTHVPTINGFATFLPPDWDLVHPEKPQYLVDVRSWLALHPVHGPVCGVDFQTGAWTVMSANTQMAEPTTR